LRGFGGIVVRLIEGAAAQIDEQRGRVAGRVLQQGVTLSSQIVFCLYVAITSYKDADS
jgi:hypothetical protein